MSPFRCPRCRRLVDVSWPSGDYLVTLMVQRSFHVTRVDGTQSMEPAGHTVKVFCPQCDATLWPALRGLVEQPESQGQQQEPAA